MPHADPEVARAYFQAYRQRKRVKLRKYARILVEKNPEKIRAYRTRGNEKTRLKRWQLGWPHRSPRLRFWIRLRPMANGCWEWQGGQKSRGYGCVYFEGKRPTTHNLAYILLIGPVPPGKELDHLCRNHFCGNPAHLEPVTHRENVLRGESVSAKNARSTHCKHGHPWTTESTRFHLTLQGAQRRTCLLCQQNRKQAAEQQKQLLNLSKEQR